MRKTIYMGSVVQVINELPSRWRGLAYALWVEGRSQASVARDLGTSRSNICHKDKRMKKYLRSRRHD
jgi:DNA-directed RNA polymerase specialized sigma subunit